MDKNTDSFEVYHVGILCSEMIMINNFNFIIKKLLSKYPEWEPINNSIYVKPYGFSLFLKRKKK